jgi:hypothetical protein
MAIVVCPYCGSEIQPDTAVCVCDSPVELAQPVTESDDRSSSLIPLLKGPYVPVPKFTFVNFARAIYHDKTGAHQSPFLLPALYGGKLGQGDKPYEALFVLLEPSIQKTEEGWKKRKQPCDTADKAIQRHRDIFLEWAYKSNSNQVLLFECFSPTGADLFQRFYVTDIWKDRTPSRPTTSEAGQYWMKKLAIELREVSAERIIFVSDDAKRYGVPLIHHGSTPHLHDIPHPQRPGMTRQQWEGYVTKLRVEILEDKIRSLQIQLLEDKIRQLEGVAQARPPSRHQV